MRFELNHDWQGNMSTPSAKVGERAKTRLLIMLCAIWLFIGLIGHNPWKPFESHTISIVKTIMESGNFVSPMAASDNQISSPPLYYLSAALTGVLFKGILPLHDAARLITGLWMLITLLMVGMTGRELWGKGVGRQTTFVFIGSLGLVLSAHLLTPHVSSLTGLATGFYALALSKRRPYRAAVLLGLGMGVSFLSKGLLPIGILLATSIALLIFKEWRIKRYIVTLLLSLVFLSPFLIIWPLLFHLKEPIMFEQWWQLSLFKFTNPNAYHGYFLNLLLWYAWPALPLALWGLWRFRKKILTQPEFQLPIVFFIVTLLLIGFSGERKDIYALPLLIPLTAIASTSIETLKRGAANALNWFGLILFGIMTSLIWLGWSAMFTNHPAKIKERITFLSGLTEINFSMLAAVIAAFVTLIWLSSILRSRHTNRSSATNWAVGITCVWTLLMTLWLPLIDSARSYGNVFNSLKSALPSEYACITSTGLGSSQRDLLHYYTDIKVYNFEIYQRINCDLYLVEDSRGKTKITPSENWNLIWQGKRISDRKESYRLFQHTY